MREVRFCVACEKWFERDKTEEVSVGATYHPRYSSVDAHITHKTVDMCKKCIVDITTRI